MAAVHRRVALCCLVALTTSFHISTFAAPPPVEAYGAAPQVADVQLNPKGNLLAWSDHRGEQATVVLFDLEAKKVEFLSLSGDQWKF